jgi:hypothetical protein
LQANSGFGRYHASSAAKLMQKVPDSIDPAQPLKADRAWRIVAGSELTPSQFHCAIVPGSAMDELLRIEAKNRAVLKAAEQAEIEANGFFSAPEWRETVSPDGVKCFVTRFAKALEIQRRAMPPIPGDLSIPPFLDQRPLPLAEAA